MCIVYTFIIVVIGEHCYCFLFVMILTDTSDLCPEVLHSSSWVLQIAGRSIHALIMEVEEPILERFIPQSSRQRTHTANLNLQIPMCTSAAWLGNFGTVSCEQFEALAMPVALRVLELWSRTAHACCCLLYHVLQGGFSMTRTAFIEGTWQVIAPCQGFGDWP